jgi:hypothetical protein
MLIFEEQPAQSELCYEDRLDIAANLRKLIGLEQEYTPPQEERRVTLMLCL